MTWAEMSFDVYFSYLPSLFLCSYRQSLYNYLNDTFSSSFTFAAELYGSNLNSLSVNVSLQEVNDRSDQCSLSVFLNKIVSTHTNFDCDPVVR